ncbi:MAG: YHYH protein [Pseudobacteriovorax sp.]|nr:YHYH protein [Pseudobacteriovorax sp.]
MTRLFITEESNVILPIKRPLTNCLYVVGTLLFLSCSDDSSDSGTTPPASGGTDTSEANDITDIELTSSSGDCSDYVGTYTSSVTDVNNSVNFTGSLVIAVSGSKCTFTSNSIPNHDFHDGSASFATDVTEVDADFEITTNPTDASSVTQLTLEYDNAVYLNGAKLDLLAAACYGVGNEPLGQEKIGCGDGNVWRYDPMYTGNDFGTDTHNAHTQPDGTYHYHGSPMALFDNTDPTAASPVIGFAADGYPIFGPYIDDNGTIREVQSGYTLKTGARVSQTGEGAFPGGNYDGTYRDDWEWTDAGDLDECNGMTVNGVYGYYVTNAFPWVMACYKGTLDASFKKGR